MLDLPTPLPCTVYFEFKATVSFANRVALSALNVAGATTTRFAMLSCLLARSVGDSVPNRY
jgi:hypothetical protein